MKRLAEKLKNVINEQDFCFTPEEMKIVNMALTRLNNYEKAEEQGLMKILPCKVGDTVYQVQKLRKRIQPYTIISIHISNGSISFEWVLKDGKGVYEKVNGFCDYDIGKTVFFTQAEAEEALKGMGEC